MVGGLDQLREKLIARELSGSGPTESSRLALLALIVLACIACSPAEEGGGARGVARAQVDSIRPMDEAVREFRADLAAVTELEGGAPSRDELVVELVRAIERSDTAAVRRMHISRAEYAYLYFPTSIYMSTPYQQPPAVAWLLSAENSEKGITRVLRRLGGHRLRFQGYACAERSREGSNSFSRSCTVRYRDPHELDFVSRRLFSTIIERGGQHKFLSYANDF